MLVISFRDPRLALHQTSVVIAVSNPGNFEVSSRSQFIITLARTEDSISLKFEILTSIYPSITLSYDLCDIRSR